MITDLGLRTADRGPRSMIRIEERL